MTLRTSAVFLACCVVFGGARAGAAAAVPAPQVTKVDGVTIVTQPDPVSQLAGVALFVPAGLDRQRLSQDGLAALVAESVLRTPVGSEHEPLEDAAVAQGGSVTFAVEGSDVRFYVEGVAADEPALLALFEQALAQPDFSPSTLADARERLGRQIALDQGVALRVGLEMLDRQFFASANVGLPEYGTPMSLAQFVPSDLQAFYAQTYRRSGALVSAAGALGALPSGTLEALARTLPAGASSAVTVKLPELRGESHQLIAHRDVPAPWLVAQYSAPELGSRDFAAMLVLAAFIDRTLADVSNVPDVVSHPLAEQAVGTIYNFDQHPASMIVYVDGGMGDPSHAFAAALAVVHVIGASNLQGSIDAFKEQAAGDFIADSTTLADRAWIAGAFARDGGSADYLNGTLAAIASVTPADLRRVAHLYLGNPTVALVLPRDEDGS